MNFWPIAFQLDAHNEEQQNDVIFSDAVNVHHIGIIAWRLAIENLLSSAGKWRPLLSYVYSYKKSILCQTGLSGHF